MAILGLNAKTYFIGTIAAPVWTDEVGVIREETINLERALADVTDRRAKGWRLQEGTLRDGSVDLQMIYDPTDADYTAFSDAFFDGTQVVLGFMDGDCTVPGVYYGLLGAFSVNSLSMPRQLEEAVIVDVSLTPVLETTTNTPPKWTDPGITII